MSEEDKDKLFHMSALNYDIETIKLMIPNIDEKDKEVQGIIQKGKVFAKYTIEKKILEMALNGDFKAIEKLERIQKMNKR